ncbi:hypothetical protein [Dyella sp. C11]|uniref:hypothetical protein n=1 Tax=Dyella sp. C11 TaxID=2126991 RepID=UPI000D6528F3|nr:hypothetical protein [Dyella sp. C11]
MRGTKRTTVSLILASTMLACCSDNPKTVWTVQEPSPDGSHVAFAKIDVWGGPGNSYALTTVSLKTANVRSVVDIVVLDDNEATLDEMKNLRLAWRSNSQLEITASAKARPTFEAIKAQGVDITLNL